MVKNIASVVKNVPAKETVQNLDCFIAQHEALAQKNDLVVTQITHPDADDRIHPGVYGGIVLAKGKPSAIYSDGTKK